MCAPSIRVISGGPVKRELRSADTCRRELEPVRRVAHVWRRGYPTLRQRRAVAVTGFTAVAPPLGLRWGHPRLEFAWLGRADISQAEIDALRDNITREPSFSRSMLTIVKTLGRGWAEAYDATRAV